MIKKIIKRVLGWSTSKKSLYFALLVFTGYTAVNLTMNWKSISVDDTLTENVFGLLKTIVIASGALGGAKKVFTEDEKGVE